jgi:NAD(P)H dehydrogenase (quinone)
MIIVTGAGGQLGRAVLDNLLKHLPADQLGATTRDPRQLTGLSQRGVRVRPADFGEPAGLTSAFEGASTVLVVSVNGIGAESVRRHRNAVDAAVAAGAERIVYTSHMGADPASPFPPMPDHAATEEVLRQSGVAFTSLRNGFYASTVPLLLGPARETGELVAPADGPVSWTAHDDLAEAAAIVLSGAATFDGPTPPLTAPDALDLADVAALLSELTGRTVRRVVADDDEWAASLMGRGVPADRAEMLLGMFRASRRGEFAATDPTLEKLIGRPPISVRSLLS